MKSKPCWSLNHGQTRDSTPCGVGRRRSTWAYHVLLFGEASHTLNRRGTFVLRGYLVVVANVGVPSHHLIEVVRLSTVLVSCYGRHPSHVIPRRQSLAFVMVKQTITKRKQQLKR